MILLVIVDECDTFFELFPEACERWRVQDSSATLLKR